MAGLKREFEQIKKTLKDHAVAYPEEWVELEDDKRTGERWIGRDTEVIRRYIIEQDREDRRLD